MNFNENQISDFKFQLSTLKSKKNNKFLFKNVWKKIFNGKINIILILNSLKKDFVVF